MAQVQKLKNAPIQEALIDFRVTFERPPSQDKFDALSEHLKTRYPEAAKIHTYQASVEFSEGKAAVNTANPSEAGIRFTSTDKAFVFQAQYNGFTLSRLKPYTAWEELRDEAKLLWELYEKYIHPTSVTRVATRYINRFESPLPVSDFNELFNSAPSVPPALPQGLSSYFIRLQIPDPASNSMILLTQALEEVTSSGAVFVVDIDVFKVIVFDAHGSECWQHLEQLRELKNKVFFSILTEKALEYFQ